MKSHDRITDLNSWWSELRLDKQFVLMGSIVVIVGMAAIGSWVVNRIENAVTHNSAASAALYAGSVIAPHLQELTGSNTISAETRQYLDGLLNDVRISSQIISVKVWRRDGHVVYSNHESIVGQQFPVTSNLARAFEGEIASEFDQLVDDENALERREKIPLLEVYSPVRDQITGRVIAVAEFYSRAEELREELVASRTGTWLVVGLLTLTMIGLLSIVVRKGSRIIEEQKLALQNRINQLSVLRNRLEKSSRQATELNERFLRRVGADLHDGPAQLLSLALLKFESVEKKRTANNDSDKENNNDVVRNALEEALKDIRNISAGLVLPEMEGRNLKQGLQRMINDHTKRTEMPVSSDIDDLPSDIDESIKISLYRLVQEGLNNGFHHSDADAINVNARFEGKQLTVSISDNGKGFDLENNHQGLGLPGLRERIESIGGIFNVLTEPGKGTTLIATFTLDS